METTAAPADAVSFKTAGLCQKLSVPSELLDKTDVFIFDCDGVIWKGDSLIDGVPKVLDELRIAKLFPGGFISAVTTRVGGADSKQLKFENFEHFYFKQQ